MSDFEPFPFCDDVLCCEDVPLDTIAAEYGTPAYVYSASYIRNRYRAYADALHPLQGRVCFAVKANSNLSVLALLAREGAGFDIVSGGELFRVLAAGGDPGVVVFSGVGKTDEEIRYALEQRIHSFNCESESELVLISQVAQSLGRTASIAVRVNPDVEASTHPYISTGLREHKFGIDINLARELYARAATLPGIVLEGVSCHIGSQLLDIQPVLQAAGKVIALAEDLRQSGLPLRFVDLGGGLGVPYRQGEQSVAISRFVGELRTRVEQAGFQLFLEPGRSIVAEAGVLLSRVLLVKRNGAKRFVILDSGMNDLIRPALYQAHHEITPVRAPRDERSEPADVVGPVCESGDFFALGREVPSLQSGDLVALRTAGAYGFVLSSNYNSRPRIPELLVQGSRVHVARQRERYDDLIRGELSLPTEGADDDGTVPAARELARHYSSKSS